MSGGHEPRRAEMKKDGIAAVLFIDQDHSHSMVAGGFAVMS